MRDYKWVYAIGELDYEFVENASSEKARALRQSEKRNTRFGIKRVAIIVIAALVTAFGLLMMNEKVRAAIFGSFLRRFDNGVEVSFANSDTESESSDSVNVLDVNVGYIPDGLAFKEHDVIPNVARFIYMETVPGNNEKDLPFVQMTISRSGHFPRGFGGDSFDKYVYQSTINGMDAYVFAVPYDYEGEIIDDVIILFGDKDITIYIQSIGLSVKEVFDIAENVTW